MNIYQMLVKEGPSLSSKLVEGLVQRGVNRVAARKRVSRIIDEDILKLRGIRFPNRESFLYLEDQRYSEQFIVNLASALKETRSAYGRAILGLEARGGIIPTIHFPVASGLPVAKAKGQTPHSHVEKKLTEFGLIQPQAAEEGDLFILQSGPTLLSRRKATMIVEDIVLGAIKSWLGKMGMASYNAMKTRDNELPQFGQFRWDIVGPTYMAGLVFYRSGKPVCGFIVGDIVLGRPISLSDLTPFLSKCDVLANQRRQTRFLPMFIADSFAPDALNELRRRGYLPARPATLFGEEIAELLRQLVRTIENAAAAVINDPKQVFEIIRKLNKLEGAALNLRGILVELIIARLYALKGYAIDIRQQILTPEAERAEIDIKAVSREEVVLIQCKGNAAGNLVDKEEIRKWMDTPVVRIKKWLEKTDSLPQKRRFEFYTSTGFTEDAKDFITEIGRKHVKQTVTFLSGEDILRNLQQQNEGALVDVFNEHFTKHAVEGRK